MGFIGLVLEMNLGFQKKTFEELVNKREKLRELSIQSAMSCVPNGTAAIDIPVLVANYVGDHCTYDHEAVKIHERLIEMQKLHPFYVYGRGVCTTYALAFNSIVSACPINPATGIVDWSCEKPIHIRTYAVMNNRHAWSALSFGQDWKYYDACCYDFNRDTKYLDMKIGQGVMTHPRYQNPSNLDSKV